MKKLACLTVALAAFASTSVALADEPSEPNAPDGPTKTWSTPPATEETQKAEPTETAPPTQTSTTTVTSAEPTNATPPPSPAYDRPSFTVYEKRRPHRAFLITGGAILAASYGATAIVTGVNDSYPDKSLYIPVAGPWLHLADREGTQGDVTETLLVGASGVVQGAGALLMLTSVIIPERVPTATITAGNAKIHFAGTGAVGTF
jgi:hypothetical protein